MPHQKIPDYTPVRINMLENAVENIGILEKSGVSDYTLFGSIITERSWSLPDDCNTYTSLYYDKPLDLDFSDGCGTWTKFGRSSVNIYCYSNYGYMTLTSNGNNSGVYTEILTEIDSTYVLTIDITSLTQYTSWAVYVRDDQSNIIASTTISQTGEINFDFTATSTTTRIEILRISGFGTSSISITQLSVTGKYHKEDVMYLSYRYGFNNMEKDDELKGTGNSYDFGARIYDPRVGRFLSLDPKTTEYPFFSPYVFAGNNPNQIS
jgi:RHS repeat-associated protein